MLVDNRTSPALPTIELGKPEPGITALTLSNFVAASNQGSAFDIGMNIASAIPNSNVSQAVGAISTISRAAQAANQGSMLGVGMALAGAVPGSNFSEAMSKVGALSSAISAANQGSLLGAGMSLAGIAPGSGYTKVIGQISQATDMLKQGLSILNPQINPTDFIKSVIPLNPVKPARQSVNITSGPPGARIKGEGLQVETCPLAEPKVGAPVNALYGSKVLAGGDDIDYSGTGYLPFTMSRIYNSQNPDTGWFGQGWTTQGYEQRLELDPQHNRIYLVDNSGRRVPFTYLAPGQHCYQPTEGITLYRKPLADDKQHTIASARPIIAGATSGTRIGDYEPLEFIIYSGNYHHSDIRPDHFNGVAQHYSYVSSRRHYGTKAVVLLSSYADKYGHQNQLHYTRSALESSAHIPQYLTDEGGGCYEFEFITINEQTRLAKLYQIEDRQEKTVLADYSYSNEGDLIKVTKRGQITREFAYKAHLMTWQTQANGQQVAYQYDSYDNPKAARVIEQAISSGRHYLFEYERGSEGLGITVVTEQPGSDLIRTRRFEYDDWYNMTSLTDPNGNTTRYRYDDNNRKIKVLRANGSHINLYHKDSNLSRVEVQTGTNPITQLPKYREVNYKYNKAGQKIAGTDALGNQQQYRYNAQGNPIEYIDALGNTTHHKYDKHGNITRQILANGSSFSFDYDDYGNLLTKTDCSGYQTRYKYDDKQRLVEITDAEGARTRYSYDNTAPHLEHLLSQVSYPDGSHIQMDYDEKARLIRYTDAKGHTVKYDYNADGKPTRREETNPTESKEAVSVKRLNESGQALEYHYDILGRLSKLTNENSEQWTFNFDANDNLISETRFDGHQSRYYFDESSQPVRQVDNPQLSRSSQYHVLMQYNLIGQLIVQHSSHYPELIDSETNKPTRAQYHRMRYNYNEIGQLISAVNPNSRTNLTYDASGRLIEETLISHLTQEGQYQVREQTQQHQYDELGNRIATTLPDGKMINQLYYGSGHLYNQSLHDPSADEHIEIRHSERNKLHLEISRQQGVLDSSYHYDTMGRLTKQHSLNHNSSNEHLTIQRDYNYDALGQLTHLSGHSVLSHKTNQQNTVNQNQQSQFTRNHQYQYDAQGRLTEHKLTDYQNHTGITEVFAFDPASNRVPVKVADDTTDKTKSNHGRPRDLIQNGKRIRYTYDTHGRVLYKTTEAVNHTDKAPRTALQLQYNANNELAKSLRTQYQGNQVINTLTEYHYDAFGRRIHKHSETRNFTQSKDQTIQTNKTRHQHTHMLWDSDLPIQEYSDTHVYTTIYDQGSFKPVARLAWLRDDISQPINDEWIIKQDTTPKFKIQVYHYHNDQLGTPNELTNDRGEVVWLADYEAWGNTAKVIYNEIKINQIQVSQNELQPIRFQGQYFDNETGLHYNRFRYYDPDMGMFTTRDPIELKGGDNVFAYAPNPIGWIDPLGLLTYPSRQQAIANLGITPSRRIYRGAEAMPAQFTAGQERLTNIEWLRIYDKDVQAHLAAGRMAPCPSTKPTPCTNCVDGAGGWQQYGGDTPSKSLAFHCGFDGFIENRIPGVKGNDAPANECFYDDSGVLVTRYSSKEKRGCRGTPDYFPLFNSGTAADKIRGDKHSKVDPGGPPGPGLNGQGIMGESAGASANYLGIRAVKGTQRQMQRARDEIIEQANSGSQWAQETIKEQSEKGQKWAQEAHNDLKKQAGIFNSTISGPPIR